MSKPVTSERAKPKCAQCRKKPIAAEYRPFCSKRCADVDLNKWLSEGYSIPGAPAEISDDTPSDSPSGKMSEDD